MGQQYSHCLKAYVAQRLRGVYEACIAQESNIDTWATDHCISLYDG